MLAVTKGFGPDALLAAAAAGCQAIGENYAQELLAKAATGASDGLDVHFIGQLQTNKVRQLATAVAVWETVDRPRLVAEIARRAPGATILVQVDAVDARESGGKGGCAPADVPGLVRHALDLGLSVDGLMTVGPTRGGVEAARPAFRSTRRLADDLGLRTCSMGMSDDLEIAVAEGSTRIRIGTALFGPRSGSPRTV